jgi:hypothetical protein
MAAGHRNPTAIQFSNRKQRKDRNPMLTTSNDISISTNRPCGNGPALSSRIIDGYPFVPLLADLGFQVPRRGTRTRCLIHGGDGPSFSFNPDKGVWICHACGESGGKLALVESVLKLDRREALRWMADRQGIQLDDWTPEQIRDYRARLRDAESEAREFVVWHDGLIETLREKRDELAAAYYKARRYLVTHDAAEAGTPVYECACYVEAFYWRRVEKLDVTLDRIRAASFGLLLPFFRKRQLLRGE